MLKEVAMLDTARKEAVLKCLQRSTGFYQGMAPSITVLRMLFGMATAEFERVKIPLQWALHEATAIIHKSLVDILHSKSGVGRKLAHYPNLSGYLECRVIAVVMHQREAAKNALAPVLSAHHHYCFFSRSVRGGEETDQGKNQEDEVMEWITSRLGVIVRQLGNLMPKMVRVFLIDELEKELNPEQLLKDKVHEKVVKLVRKDEGKHVKREQLGQQLHSMTKCIEILTSY
eukprot:m51a1_g11643 hypothetical protein (230) ;mRNA; r:1993-2682